MYKVFELSKEWIENKNGSTCKKLVEFDNIDAVDLIAAIRLAQKKYPNKSLRISDDKYSVDITKDGDLDIDELETIRSATGVSCLPK